EFGKRFNCVMTANSFNDALATLLGEAMNTEPQTVWIRVGPYANGIVLDLGTLDGSAVVVDATGWRIVERSPILFQRTALSGALPTPITGGSLDSLRDLLNVSSTTWPILLGYMVTALIPEIPHPILMLGGGQGTGKSTAAKFICKLLDPSDAINKGQPRDPESWATMASNSWTILIDNVSSIPAWMSDSLCKAVTGDGFIKRALYTNNEPLVLSFLRVIMLTSIDAGALRGDLGERLVLVDLEPIHESKRKTDKELNRMYDAAQPAILGALLDLLVQVMSKLETVKVPRLPRMADFAKVLAAMDTATGMGSLAIYETQGNRIAGEVIESDPYGSAIVRFMEKRQDWSGTLDELLHAITPFDGGREWTIN
ncbi:MAG: ATP-binding protein, partial [Planctomycetes bacterium]|nr:ATP-binding protein [Planctomycetota bacterium]